MVATIEGGGLPQGRRALAMPPAPSCSTPGSPAEGGTVSATAFSAGRPSQSGAAEVVRHWLRFERKERSVNMIASDMGLSRRSAVRCPRPRYCKPGLSQHASSNPDCTVSRRLRLPQGWIYPDLSSTHETRRLHAEVVLACMLRPGSLQRSRLSASLFGRVYGKYTFTHIVADTHSVGARTADGQ